MAYKAGDIKRAIINSTRPGVNRTKAFAVANELVHVNKFTPKNSNRPIFKQKAAVVFEKFQKERLIKSNVDGHHTYGLTGKREAEVLVGAVSPPEAPLSASGERQRNFEEKQERRAQAGLKESAAGERAHAAETARGKAHKPVVMEKALDKVSLEEIDQPKDAAISVNEVDKSAAKQMGLTSGINVPPREIEKKAAPDPTKTGARFESGPGLSPRRQIPPAHEEQESAKLHHAAPASPSRIKSEDLPDMNIG